MVAVPRGSKGCDAQRLDAWIGWERLRSLGLREQQAKQRRALEVFAPRGSYLLIRPLQGRGAKATCQQMKNQVKNSMLFLLALGVILSWPIVALSFSVHGIGHALITEVLGVVLVVLGPISALADGLDAMKVESVIAVSVGAVLVWSWVKLLKRRERRWLQYLPIVGWALMGAYFGVLQFYRYAT